MKNRTMIIGLSVLMFTLIIAKLISDNIKANTYPLFFDKLNIYTERDEYDRVTQKVISDRYSHIAPEGVCPFLIANKRGDAVSFGMARNQILSMGFVTDSICIGNRIIPAEVYYCFSDDDRLEQINVKVFYTSQHNSKYNFDLFLKSIKELYGSKYLHLDHYVYGDADFWVYEDCFAGLYIDDDHLYSKYAYFTISDISNLSSSDLLDIFHYGICTDGGSMQESYISRISANKGNSRTTERTYKYGNSDTYKGSSQQAADLAAIDRYGANNPDFW